MYDSHGFFIPDQTYCVDVVGLLKYLGMKVGSGRYCIRCTVKRFRDLGACQAHMRDKSHCLISLDGDAVVEYLDFYDYGELLKDEDDVDNDVALDTGYTLILPSGTKLGHRSLMRYYKQRLRSNEDQQRVQNARMALKEQTHLKTLGWTGSTGTAAVQRARDFKFMTTVVKKLDLQQGLRSNKLFKSRGRDDQM